MSYKPILCLGVLSFLTFILRKEMSEERTLICMVALSVHVKNKENLLLVKDTKYSHNQKVLILRRDKSGILGSSFLCETARLAQPGCSTSV